jgi:membrane-associated protein
VNPLERIIDFILHIDRHLAEIIASYGVWTYAVLFLIIAFPAGRLPALRRWRLLRQARDRT